MSIRDWFKAFHGHQASLAESRPEETSSVVLMVVGLGNPGSGYSRMRHNAGFWVVDLLAQKLGIEVNKKKFGGLFGQGDVEGKKLILLKPQQYMNQSGQVVATAAGFYRLPTTKLLVISDDMAIEPGRIKIRTKGSAGGHNGLADIIEKLGTDAFARLRVGIGKNESQIERDYVLSVPSAGEKELIDQAVKNAAEAVLCWLGRGIDAAMNEFNTKNNTKE